MGNDCKWNVGALNDIHIWPHTMKQIIEHVIASFTIDIMHGTNYRFVEP